MKTEKEVIEKIYEIVQEARDEGIADYYMNKIEVLLWVLDNSKEG